MDKSISHVLQRQYGGQASAEIVIAWLNHTQNRHANTRVVKLIDLLRELDQAERADLPRVRLGPWSKIRATKEQARNLKSLGVLRRRLKRLLRTYWFSPQRERTAHGRWIVSWKHSHHGSRLRIVVSEEGDEIPVSEGDVVLRLFRLGEEGYFDHLGRCRFCSKWLYARFKHQQYCSVKCQMNAYKSSEEWKRHRREYMRKHRKLKASGKVR